MEEELQPIKDSLSQNFTNITLKSMENMSQEKKNTVMFRQHL